MRPLLLFADIREDPLRSPEVMWGMGLLIAAMLVGAAIIYAVDKWRQRAVAGPTEVDATSALTGYRDMYENGEITEAEYAELRRRVAEKVKAPPPKPAAPAGTMPPLPSLQPGERATVNPPEPPTPAPEPPKPPDSA
jgi:hypothetical protein